MDEQEAAKAAEEIAALEAHQREYETAIQAARVECRRSQLTRMRRRRAVEDGTAPAAERLAALAQIDDEHERCVKPLEEQIDRLRVGLHDAAAALSILRRSVAPPPGGLSGGRSDWLDPESIPSGEAVGTPGQ